MFELKKRTETGLESDRRYRECSEQRKRAEEESKGREQRKVAWEKVIGREQRKGMV